MSEEIRKADDSPFSTENAVKAALTKNGKEVGQYDILQEGEGFIARTKGADGISIKPLNKPLRTPIGVRHVLRFPKRPGYVRRVVNDEDDRIEMLKQGGYAVVTGKMSGASTKGQDASQMGSAVTKPVGGGTKGILMEIPEELYREYQESKAKHLDEIDKSMRLNIKGTTADGEYGSVKIS